MIWIIVMGLACGYMLMRLGHGIAGIELGHKREVATGWFGIFGFVLGIVGAAVIVLTRHQC